MLFNQITVGVGRYVYHVPSLRGEGRTAACSKLPERQLDSCVSAMCSEDIACYCIRHMPTTSSSQFFYRFLSISPLLPLCQCITAMVGSQTYVRPKLQLREGLLRVVLDASDITSHPQCHMLVMQARGAMPKLVGTARDTAFYVDLLAEQVRPGGQGSSFGLRRRMHDLQETTGTMLLPCWPTCWCSWATQSLEPLFVCNSTLASTHLIPHMCLGIATPGIMVLPLVPPGQAAVSA
jgi:hypothetical protein